MAKAPALGDVGKSYLVVVQVDHIHPSLYDASVFVGRQVDNFRMRRPHGPPFDRSHFFAPIVRGRLPHVASASAVSMGRSPQKKDRVSFFFPAPPRRRLAGGRRHHAMLPHRPPPPRLGSLLRARVRRHLPHLLGRLARARQLRGGQPRRVPAPPQPRRQRRLELHVRRRRRAALRVARLCGGHVQHARHGGRDDGGAPHRVGDAHRRRRPRGQRAAAQVRTPAARPHGVQHGNVRRAGGRDGACPPTRSGRWWSWGCSPTPTTRPPSS